MSFSNAKKFLERNISVDSADWKWGTVHAVDFSNLPWSGTSLKFIYHRQIKAGGNSNTPQLSKYQITKNIDKVVISSNHSPNYKQLI